MGIFIINYIACLNHTDEQLINNLRWQYRVWHQIANALNVCFVFFLYLHCHYKPVKYCKLKLDVSLLLPLTLRSCHSYQYCIQLALKLLLILVFVGKSCQETAPTLALWPYPGTSSHSRGRHKEILALQVSIRQVKQFPCHSPGVSTLSWMTFLLKTLCAAPAPVPMEKHNSRHVSSIHRK